MRNWLRKFFGPSKEELQEKAETEQLLSSYSSTVQQQMEAIETMKSRLEEIEKERQELAAKVAEREAKYNSNEPWVEIKSADFNELKGVHIELDWNEAFIVYLKESGIKGPDDETIVQKWLALLYRDLDAKLAHVALDNTEKLRVRDFDVNDM